MSGPIRYTRLNLVLDAAPKTKITLHDAKMLTLADGLAASSECHPHKLGAVIYRKNEVIGIGKNSNRSHPVQAAWNPFSIRLHAEIAALINGLRDNSDAIDGAAIAVSRVTRRGVHSTSYPCEHCFAALKHAKINRFVCYDTSDNPVSVTI